MVQRRAKYYQKLLSQQAALVSQPPARLNVSNPPPLWGLKFLLSTSGPACWMQTGLEFCPHANSFPPYRSVPAVGWQLRHWTHRCGSSAAASPMTLTGVVVFLHPPSQNSFFITVGSLKGMILWNHHGSKCLLQSSASTFSQPPLDSQENGNLTSEGKVQFRLEITIGCCWVFQAVAVWKQDNGCPAFPELFTLPCFGSSSLPWLHMCCLPQIRCWGCRLLY